MKFQGKDVITWSINDYLGLANHPGLIRALKQGAERFGVGSGAAHLISGHSYAHQALEQELAEFVEEERQIRQEEYNKLEAAHAAGTPDRLGDRDLADLDGAHESAVLHHRRPVAQAFDLMHVVVDEEDADALVYNMDQMEMEGSDIFILNDVFKPIDLDKRPRAAAAKRSS